MNFLAKTDGEGNLIFSKSVNERYKKFLLNNPFHECELTVKIIDSPEYYQHKYYRGYVLPFISEGQGELDDAVTHNLLKREFLYFGISELSEIPEHHKKNCMILTKEGKEGKEEIKYVAYIPSTSVLTFEEMKSYILKCEHLRDDFLDWSMKSKEQIKEMFELRKQAMGK